MYHNTYKGEFQRAENWLGRMQMEMNTTRTGQKSQVWNIFIVGRDRWVLFKKWDHDASQVPPEWHQWMHRMTDEIPSEMTFPKSFFTPKHAENLTGTAAAFKTYDTVKAKIGAWQPAVKPRE
jgi:NADH:ubiquinone oxidoreductase subunit